MHQDLHESNQARIIGIDLLRIIATIMVIILHLLYYGDILINLPLFSSSYIGFWFLGIMCVCAVNCFGLISGYVSYGRTIKLRNLIRLSSIVIFYCIFLTCLIYFTFPNLVTIDLPHIVSTFTPVVHNTYWYFSAYFALYLFTPILNLGIQKAEKSYLRLLICFMVIVFSISPTILNKDPFQINSGFSVLWLAILYIIGAYLKKYRYDFGRNKKLFALLYFTCVFMTWITKLALEYWSYNKFGDRLNLTMMVYYCAPGILFSAISLLLLFSSIQLPNKLSKLINCFVPLCFSVYLIHDHPFVRKVFLSHRMKQILEIPFYLQIPAVLIIAIFIFGYCCGVDYIRIELFNFLRVERLIQYIEKKIKPSE